MSEIYLVRHPETIHNINRAIVSGRSNSIELTPLGIAQAEQFDFRHEGGESLISVGDRMLDFMQRAHQANPESTILAATHGQAIRAVVGRLLGWSRFETTIDPTKVTPNVSLTHLSVTDETITVNYVGKQIITQSASKE